MEMQLRMLNGVGAGNYVLDAVQIPPTERHSLGCVAD